jgi:hypothetical protein
LELKFVVKDRIKQYNERIDEVNNAFQEIATELRKAGIPCGFKLIQEIPPVWEMHIKNIQKEINEREIRNLEERDPRSTKQALEEWILNQFKWLQD